MQNSHSHTVTIIYYSNDSLELHCITNAFPQNEAGRVILPASFKEGKSIIAVCEGKVKILNQLGDRITLVEDIWFSDKNKPTK